VSYRQPERTDRLFAALGNRTRRDIVRRTAGREQSVSSLARHYAMSLTAVQKHVAVLEQAELVTKRRQGREQLVSAQVLPVRDARRQLEALESLWRDRLDRFGEVLAELPPLPQPEENQP
jgi:DNA-binding transcriptional ArsR family regulator